jgi:hypothetical protein
MPAFCARKRHLQQQFPSSLYTQFFMGCQLAAWSTGHRAKRIKNIVSCASRSTAEQHATPTVFAVTPPLVGRCGNYRDITARKKKSKKRIERLQAF